MAKKAASGTGNIRKKTKVINGKEYTWWEARYTAGYDPGTGKQIQRSVSGKTQKEVAKKLKEATAAIDAGTYITPNKISVGEWLDIWTQEYLNGVKPATVCAYKATVKNHLKPNLGFIRLDALTAHTIQAFYNQLSRQPDGPSPKTIKNIHGVLHRALQQAVLNEYIRSNPTNACILPRVEKKEISPLDEDQITQFLKAIRGHKFEDLFIVTLFTGMRKAEVMGLTWDCVDLNRATILVNKQLQQVRGGHGEYRIATTKNGKGRLITVAPFIVQTLRKVRHRQLANRLQYGECYEDSGFVFTDELGHHLKSHTVYINYKKIVKQLGLDESRFHDLRHSYAVAAIRSGDDIKTVQEHLGHATASFTLDVYGHVTDRMQQESAARMENFIKAVNK